MNDKVTLAQVELGYAGLYALRDKVAKLNKRAQRCGVSEIVITIVREFTLTDEITNRDIQRYDVEINGCAPCIMGWYLAARIENNAIIGTVVKVVPGRFQDDDYSGYRDHNFFCDHCKTSRKRNDVFVMKHEVGFEKVVGRTCLADYLRTEDAASFAKYAEFVDECDNYTDESLCGDADDMGFGGRDHRPNIGIQSFLTTVQCCTRRMGWVSRTAAFTDDALQATADAAYFVIYGHDTFWEEFINRNELFETDGDRDLARRAVEWATSLIEKDTAKSEYRDIIRRIAIAGETDEKLSGYSASIIRAYQKDCEWREEKSVGTKDKVHIGSIKERLKDRVVKVLRVRHIEGDYGIRTIIVMELALPDKVIAPLTWFATGSKEFEEGATYIFNGTVKDHKDDKFGKQTIVSRCKLSPVI